MSEGTDQVPSRRSWRQIAQWSCHGIAAAVGSLCVLAGFAGVFHYPRDDNAGVLLAGGGVIFLLLGNALRDER